MTNAVTAPATDQHTAPKPNALIGLLDITLRAANAESCLRDALARIAELEEDRDRVKQIVRSVSGDLRTLYSGFYEAGDKHRSTAHRLEEALISLAVVVEL